MSAPSESATSLTPCACTNISLMQLFHELKQKFPVVPDHVVSNTIELYCHDKQACETHLHSEAKASLTHAYHAPSSAAARQLNDLRHNPPGQCRNQPIIKQEISKSTAIQSITCQGPQTAVLSSSIITDETDKQPTTDDNQNVVELIKNESERNNNNRSPITVINIDNCYAKYSAESPSDPELTNENKKEQPSISQNNNDLSESTNYRILKSNKVKCNLHEKLEKSKEKKTIKKSDHSRDSSQEKKEVPQEKKEVPQEKPIRPNTLNFIKPSPDIAFKPTTLKEPESEPCRTISPAPVKQEIPPKEKLDKEKAQYRPERGYPLNLSVNVNCHMDYSRSYEPWFEDYSSPRAITSVNLTVCTPTSNMASPVRESREDDGGFEGHVTVTVSPSTARAPRRPAPPPPGRPSRLESPRPTRAAPEPPSSSSIDRSLIERQKERLGRLAAALAQERGRLAQLTRETQILAAPPPPPRAAANLREYVENLRDKCDTLAKRLEMGGDNERQDSDNFYSNIYTGQPSSWQCHMCTFRNHPLLDKCEECDMPRIFVGTSPARTHDSGFGSFRDRNRRAQSGTGNDETGFGSFRSRQNDETTDVLEVSNVECLRALPKLNC
ncbi:hypothetical protein O0L34_g116 [Tuta absoluta]|nr:hypothetical protein O0L34_g116 [Tuta absoluta]